MKAYERRAAGKPSYYKLATWDARQVCWNDGKRQYDTAEQAKADAKKPGKYRLSLVDEKGNRTDLEPFTV